MTLQFDRFFVVTFLGLSTLAYYGLAATIFNHIHMGFNSIAPWLAPKITKMKSKGLDTAELYHTARNLSLLISLSALLLFSFVYAPILKIILGHEKFLRTDGYIRLFAVFEIFFVYSIIPNFFMNAAGHEKLYFKLVLFYCGAIVSGMTFGYIISGNAEGILLGMSAATGISMLIQDIVINRMIFGNYRILNSISLFIPAVAVTACLLTPLVIIKTVLFGIAMLSLYIVFFGVHKINFKLVRLD
jgi:O-antigen/teichoic acid export membrane protein